MENHSIDAIGEMAIESVLTGELDPQIEILRRIAEDRSTDPAIRYMAACCIKFQRDAYNRESEEMHEWERREYG